MPASADRGPHSKLSKKQAEKIKSLYAAGDITCLKLGQQFGVNQSTISRIIRGEDQVRNNGHEYLSGPKLADYIRRIHPRHCEALSESQVRRINAWSNSVAASIWTADEILTALGDHLDLLPDDFSLPPQKPQEALSAAKKAEVVKRYRAGEAAAKLGREIDRSASAVVKWSRKTEGYVPRSKNVRTGVREMRHCEGCEEEFEILVSVLKRGSNRGRFCSVDCARASRRAGLPPKSK